MLVVHRKTTNNAVRGELGAIGLLSMLISMLGLSIKYWWKLNVKCFNGCNSLVVNALIDNRKLCDKGIFSWSSGIKNALNLIIKLDIWERPTLLTAGTFSTDIMLNLTNVYDSLWTTSISHVQSKLCSYCLFKKEFCLENYVMMFGRINRFPFTKLRVSAHSLMIEKGCHLHPKIPPEKVM